jgi:ribosomal protein S18 acetylase RimI-like enzyme
MGQLRDRDEIRRRLEQDRAWAVYALGDLAPGYREHSEWYAAEHHPDALALVYRAGEWPILFTLGEPHALPAVLAGLPPEPRLSLSIRPEHLSAVEDRWAIRHTNTMWRMLLDSSAPEVAPAHPVMPVRPEDEPALLELFQNGRATGEEPDYFLPEMLAGETYFAVSEGARWVAAAGTHLIAVEEGVATIGNVYVHRDRRGLGLARSVVGAVIRELRRRQIATIALNVRQSNPAALRVYERLGFRTYCPFLEGLAELR